MKSRKKISFLRVILIMNLLMSGLSLLLGCLSVSSNNRILCKNDAGIKLANLIGNIEYANSFIGDIRKYYGLGQQVLEYSEDLPQFVELAVVKGDDYITKTTDEPIPADIMHLKSGSYEIRGDRFYMVFPCADDSKLIAVEDAKPVLERESEFYPKLFLIAGIGFIVTSIVIIILGKSLKADKKRERILSFTLAAWILVFGGYVGLYSARNYNDSINNINTVITEAFQRDLDSLSEKGVTMSTVSDVDSYLERYTDNIQELESISYSEEKGLTFTRSESYIGKVYIDYALQTILSLTFIIMILAEYSIYLNKCREEDEEKEARDEP